MPRAIGRLGAGSCTIFRQPAQTSFGRTCRITLKLAGTYSSISATSSPIRFIAPPQSGQVHAGACSTVSRGRRSGNGRRVGRSRCCGLAAASSGAFASRVARLASSSSTRSSSWPIFAIELLRGATELQAPQLGDEELEVLDLVVAFGEPHLPLDDQALERFDVIGEIMSVEHIASLLIDFARVK